MNDIKILYGHIFGIKLLWKDSMMHYATDMPIPVYILLHHPKAWWLLSLHENPVVFHVLKRSYIHNSINLSVFEQEKTHGSLEAVYSKLIFFFGKKVFLLIFSSERKINFFGITIHQEKYRAIVPYRHSLVYSDNIDVKLNTEEQ